MRKYGNTALFSVDVFYRIQQTPYQQIQYGGDFQQNFEAVTKPYFVPCLKYVNCIVMQYTSGITYEYKIL